VTVDRAQIDRSMIFSRSQSAFVEIHLFNMWRQEMIRTFLTTATVIAEPIKAHPLVSPPTLSRRASG
jgi:hypothetical protein